MRFEPTIEHQARAHVARRFKYTAIPPANHRTFFISLFPTEFSQSPQPLTAPDFRLHPPRLLSLVDEYHQTNRRQSPQRAKLGAPSGPAALRPRQSRLQRQLPEI